MASDPVSSFYQGPTRQVGGNASRTISLPMTQKATLNAVPVFRGKKDTSNELAKEPQVAQAVKIGKNGKQYGIERIKENKKDTFETEFKKVESLKRMARRKAPKKMLYQYREVTPEKPLQPQSKLRGKGQQYKRGRLNALLGDDTY